jgi:hypothetical protein
LGHGSFLKDFPFPRRLCIRTCRSTFSAIPVTADALSARRGDFCDDDGDGDAMRPGRSIRVGDPIVTNSAGKMVALFRRMQIVLS